MLTDPEKKMMKNLLDVLKECYEHLDYCGWGDSWEHELALSSRLPNRAEAAIEEAEEYFNGKG